MLAMPSFPWADLHEQLGQGSTGSVHVMCLQLQEYVESMDLGETELTELIESVPALLTHSNPKVQRDTLHILHTVVLRQGDNFRRYVPSVMGPVVASMGENASPVRTEAIALLVAFMQLLGAVTFTSAVDAVWTDKNWRVRQGMSQVIGAAAGQFRLPKLTIRERDALVGRLVVLLEDSNSNVRESALDCIVNMILSMGLAVKQTVIRLNVRPAHLREIDSRVSAAPRLEPPEGGEEGHYVRSRDTSPGKQSPPPKRATSPPTTRRAFSGSTTTTAPPPAARRGGYMDAGGYDEAELRNVDAIPVDSERTLRAELDQIGSLLALAVDWDKRVQAMLRFEGLLKGGAGNFECFYDQVYTLKEPLMHQVQDRRSAIVRQACHLLCCLAVALGNRFEHMAQAFVPVLLKVTPITVQVMADAADTALHTILTHCHAPRVVVKICESLINDKSPRMRTFSAKYLLQMIEEWDPAEYERHVESVEHAIKAATGDALADVRATSRLIMGAFAYAFPDRAQSLIRRVDGATAEKLNAAVQQYPGAGSMVFPKEHVDVQVAVQQHGGTTRRFMASPMVGPDTARGPRPSGSLTARPHYDRPTTRPGSSGGQRRPGSAGNLYEITRGERLVGRGSEAGRIPADKGAPLGSARRDSYTGQRMGAQRLPMRTPREDAASLRRPVTAAISSCSTRVPGRRASRDERDGSIGGYSLQSNEDGVIVEAASVVQALNAIRSGGRDWQKKADGLLLLTQAMEGSEEDAQSDITAFADRIATVLVESIGDPHHKVACAGMDALAVALRLGQHAMQPQLDKLMAGVFSRSVEPKEPVKRAAYAALTSFANHLHGDIILTTLTRCMDVIKSVKGKQAVLDHCATTAGQICSTAFPAPIKAWVSRCTTLTISDRSPDVRKAACVCLAALYQHDNGAAAIQGVVCSMTTKEQGPLRKALAPYIPSLEKPPTSGTPTQQHTKSSKGHRASLSGTYEGPFEGTGSPRGTPRSAARTQAFATPASTLRPSPMGADSPRGVSPMQHTPYGAGGGVAASPSVFPTSFRVAPSPTPSAATASPGVYAAAYTGHGPSGLRHSHAHPTESIATHIDHLASTPTLDTLNTLADLAAQGGPVAWGPHIHRALPLLLRVLDSGSDSALREAAALVVGELSVHCVSLVGAQDVVVSVVDGLVGGYGDPSREVVAAVDDAAVHLVAGGDKTTMLAALMHWLPTSTSSSDIHHTSSTQHSNTKGGTAAPGVLHGAIINIARVVNTLTAPALRPHMHTTLMPGLAAAFDNPQPDVRRAVVLCLVALWKVLGEEMEAKHLVDLKPTQQKLVEVYMQRATQQHGTTHKSPVPALRLTQLAH